MRKLLLVIAIVVVAIPLVAFIAVAVEIAGYAGNSDPGPADAALVLGAAVADEAPTPVFAERLRHAISLYSAGRVRKLVMTGGQGPGDKASEAEAGRDFAIAAGVPAADILVETASHTTFENMVNSLPLLAEHSLNRVLVVSDPLHMRRAIRMARDVGIDAHPSPTPTSRIQSWASQLPMLAREVYFYIEYMVIDDQPAPRRASPRSDKPRADLT